MGFQSKDCVFFCVITYVHKWCFLVQRCALLTFHLIIEPPFTHPSVSPLLSVSLSLKSKKESKSVSDRVCYTSRMPACSVPTSPSTGDVVSSPLSPGNRHVRSPPQGAGVGREAEEWEETSSFFLLFCFVFLTSQSHPMICTHTNTQKNIGTHKNSPSVVLQSKEWQ